MAVVPMQKMQVVVHQSEADALLTCLQSAGAMEFTESEVGSGIAPAQVVAPHAELLPRVQHAVGFLSTYEEKPGLLQQLRNGVTTELSEADLAQRVATTDATNAVVCDVQSVQVQFEECSAAVIRIEQRRAALHAWLPVSLPLAQLDTATTRSVLVAAPAASTTPFMDVVADTLAAFEATTSVTAYADVALVTMHTSRSAEVLLVLQAADLQIVPRPAGSETAAVELVAVEEALAAAKGELAVAIDQAEHLAQTHLKELRITQEILEWEQQRFATLQAGQATATTAVFTGWLRADKRAAVEAALQQQGVAAVFTDIAPETDEEPPVEIQNTSFFRPFEAVTRLYGMPGYTDLDPTLFLAGFFFLFFGLSLTDVGYGATLAVISGGLLLFAKLKDGVRQMMKLLFYIGIATILVGMLFGGYFGIAPELLPEPLLALQQFDPIGNPLPVFYLALGLGVFQVMVGMVLKIYSDARNNKLIDGLWEQGPWLFLFGVGIAYVLTMFEYLTVATDVLVRFAYIGLGLLVFGAVRQSTGVVSALIAIGGSLYGSVGYLSDILSYSRLLALGLATTALAFAVNLIAGIVSETHPVLGPVFAVVILIIGHVFTLAVNTLGAFIHSARLQFVEFFGKFVAGTGRSFAPLTRSEQHITVTKE